MTSRPALVVVLLCAAMGRASADDRTEGFRRDGWVIGVAIGPAALDIGHSGQPDQRTDAGFAMDFQLGGMVRPELAIIAHADLAGGSIQGMNQVSAFEDDLAVGARWFPTGVFWLEAGIGAAGFMQRDRIDVFEDRNHGALLYGAAGVELMQAKSFTLDIRVRASTMRFGDEAGVTVSSGLVGVNWY